MSDKIYTYRISDHHHVQGNSDYINEVISKKAPSATEPVARFGFGNLLVGTGFHYGTPAVFIGPSPEAGPIGENARPEHKLPTDRLVPGEFFMTFPTEEQAKRVADALVNAPVTEPVAWQWRMNHPDAEWSQGLHMDLYEKALAGMEKRLLYAAPPSPVTVEEAAEVIIKAWENHYKEACDNYEAYVEDGGTPYSTWRPHLTYEWVRALTGEKRDG